LKLFDRRGSVACVMVIRIGKDDYTALPHLIAEIDSTGEFSGAIYHNLVPGRCLLFDTLAITEPSDVTPVRSDRVKFQFGLGMNGRS